MNTHINIIKKHVQESADTVKKSYMGYIDTLSCCQMTKVLKDIAHANIKVGFVACKECIESDEPHKKECR